MASDWDDEAGTTRVAAHQRGMRVPSVDLVVVEGPSRGERCAVHGGLARVGAALGNDLRLADPTVSRLHCEVKVRPDGIALRDRGSTNGTYVSGVRLRDGDVPAGALVRLGRSVFRVEAGDEPAFVDVSSRTSFGELVGQSVDMRRLYAILERVAPTETTVLIEGETGTGKDVVARSLHAASRRAAGPFVAINCGAIPENLIESELFGHVRGSFSGATADRKGVFEEANGGTLFLDEIGEMPLALQAKLLRAIESRSVRRVGASAARPVDVRIVAATNRALARCVNEGTFREDLYYRLAVVEVTLPPLRDRPDDVPLLAFEFYRRFVPEAKELPPELARAVAGRSFAGNVRELRNFVERAVSLGLPLGGGGLRAQAPPASTRAAGAGTTEGGIADLVPWHLPLKDARQAWTEQFELVYARAVLDRAGGNVTRAAERAGVSRRFLQRMLARLGIRAAGGGDPQGGDDDG